MCICTASVIIIYLQIFFFFYPYNCILLQQNYYLLSIIISFCFTSLFCFVKISLNTAEKDRYDVKYFSSIYFVLSLLCIFISKFKY
ncbi:hypothetical protein PUN28_006115 [Cardiocondyla obscurior]|uniref:Uncharacterized protein n=1 Tax=Cardiocondyla obscurior TaxID=286306 RepID=A0AAW2GC50_9HYME